MSEALVTCPHCKSEIPLSRTLAEPLVEAERARMRKESDAALRKLQTELDARFAEEKKHALERIEAQAMRDSAEKFEAMEKELEDKRAKLAKAQRLELELLKQKRELVEAQETLELQKQRELDAEREKIREGAQRESAERHKLEKATQDKKLADLTAQLADMQRRVEQGSQQLQGEVQELDLEESLRNNFVHDRVEPVPKGQQGGDCFQRVCGPSAELAGTILWECKRTKAWSDGWLAKLRDDQRASKSEIAVLVTTTLPKTVERFGMVQGIWVTDAASAIPLALALRQQLLELSRTRQALVGQQGKMEIIYEYLCGPRFRQRVQGIVEAFGTMRSELEAEKRAMKAQWAKREKQLELMIDSTTGLYGDLQGIAGAGLPEIEALRLKQLEGKHLDSKARDTQQLELGS